MITLAGLEQETAQRVGPYVVASTDTQVPNTANFSYANFPSLQSDIELDLVTNLWLLRRGTKSDGSAIVVNALDRQRQVSSYDPSMGRVFVDRPWGQYPVPAEVCEFHHLDPQLELRPSVMAGLRRCFFDDTIQVQPTSQYYAIDVTAQAPWIITPDQIVSCRYGWLFPYADAPFDTYMQAGHVFLTGIFGAYGYYYLPTSLWLMVQRPSWSLVNGLDSSGPVLDTDGLDIDLDYAASAAHIEAWHHFPARMAVAAAGGTQATQAMAAAEFSRQAGFWGPQRPTRVGFQSLVRLGGGGSWINGPSGVW